MSLEIVFWDVEHGSSTYIKTPNSKNIIIDLGVGSYEGNNETFSPLLHLKNKWNVKRLDTVVITHPHKDHIDDIANFDQMSPRVLACPRHLSKEDILKDVSKDDLPLFDKYFELVNRYSGEVKTDTDMFIPDNVGGAKLQMFSPKSCGTLNINNHSIGTVVSYAQSKVIIPGDNEPPSWKELLEDSEFVSAIKNADILLAPHHGRESGFCKEIFEHFSPYLTVISDGRFCDTSATNRYCNVTRGWKVHYRSGGSEERKCLTTRNDGFVVVKLGIDEESKRPFIEVRAKGK